MPAFLYVEVKRTLGTASKAEFSNVSDNSKDVLREYLVEALVLAPRNVENLKTRSTSCEDLLFAGANEITCDSLHRCRWSLDAQGVHRHCREACHGGRLVRSVKCTGEFVSARNESFGGGREL